MKQNHAFPLPNRATAVPAAVEPYWTRGRCIAIASPSCVYCRGMGIANANATGPCKCVLRKIFTLCYCKFQDILESHNYTAGPTMRRVEGAGKSKTRSYGFIRQEYCADFHLITQRSLAPMEWDAFKWHYLYGADYKLCCTKLGIDKGAFYHMIYRIQEKLGHVFATTHPYPLYPTDEYFGGKARTSRRLTDQQIANLALPA